MQLITASLALSYYHLENHLFQIISPRFHKDHSLAAVDFFCIVIWKANRAKSYAAKRLIKMDPGNRTKLDPIVRDSTRAIHDAPDAKSRLSVLRTAWGFGLPMTTAILAVLYPGEFTVYDVRVCQQLGGFNNLDAIRDFDLLWNRYSEFQNAVCNAAPRELCLRDKDRFLWGKSFAEDLAADVENGFCRAKQKNAPQERRQRE